MVFFPADTATGQSGVRPGARQLHVDDVLFVPKVGQQFESGKGADPVKSDSFTPSYPRACAGKRRDGGYVDGAFRKTDAGEQRRVSMTRVSLQFPENFLLPAARGTICSYFVAMRLRGITQESARRNQIRSIRHSAISPEQRTNSRGTSRRAHRTGK